MFMMEKTRAGQFDAPTIARRKEKLVGIKVMVVYSKSHQRKPQESVEQIDKESSLFRTIVSALVCVSF